MRHLPSGVALWTHILTTLDLAQGRLPAGSPQHTIVSVTALAAIVVFLSALVAGLALAALSRYRRRVLGKATRMAARGRPHTLDAWRESARRVQSPPPESDESGSDDETVDLDPDPPR